MHGNDCAPWPPACILGVQSHGNRSKQATVTRHLSQHRCQSHIVIAVGSNHTQQLSTLFRIKLTNAYSQLSKVGKGCGFHTKDCELLAHSEHRTRRCSRLSHKARMPTHATYTHHRAEGLHRATGQEKESKEGVKLSQSEGDTILQRQTSKRHQKPS